MAQVCDICGKGPQFGNNISHAHNITRRRWSVNLYWIQLPVAGLGYGLCRVKVSEAELMQ